MSNNNVIQNYIINSSTNLPFSSPLGTSITDRTTSSPKFIMIDGATVNEVLLPSTSLTLAADFTTVDAVVTPFSYGAQTAQLPSFPPCHNSVTENLLPSSTNIIYGVRNGTSGYVQGDSSDQHYGTALSNLSESSSSVIPKGTKIGISNFDTPSNVNIGTFYGTGGSGNSQLANLLFQRAAGTADTHGAKAVQRPISQWPNTVDSGTSNATAGYGSTATVSAVLAQLSYVSTVTVGQNDEDGTTMGFWVRKDTSWPGDFIIVDASTGLYLRGIDQKGIVDLESQLFIEDFYLDTSKWIIKDNMVLTNTARASISVPANMTTAAPITVAATFSGALTSPTVAAVDTVINEINAGMVLLFPTSDGTNYGTSDAYGAALSLTGGTDRTDRNQTIPSLTFVIPAKTVYPGSYVLRPLTNLPAGFTFPAGTVISSIPGTNLRRQQKLSFNKVVFSDGFNIESDIILGQVVPSGHKIKIPTDNKILAPVTVPVSAYWNYDLQMNAVIVNDSYTTQGDIKLTQDIIVRSGITLAEDSRLAPGTILPAGTTSDDKMTFTDEIQFASQTSITADFSLEAPIACDAMDGTDTKILSVGTIIRAVGADGKTHTILPANMILTNGSSIPGPVKVSPAEQVSFLPTLEIKGGVKVGPSFQFGVTTQFEPETEFAAGTTLGNGTLLPSGTSILKDSKFSFIFPLPATTVLPKTTKMYIGTTFYPGSNLPAVPCRPHEDATLALNATPFRIVYIGTTAYIVYASGTIFSQDFQIPKNSVLLASNTMAGVTIGATAFNSTVYTSGAFVTTPTGTAAASYTFDEGEVKFLAGGQGLALQAFTLSCGVAMATGIQLRGEAFFANDLAIPFIDSSLVFANVSFNVNFVLKKDVTIDADFTVNADNYVYWPVNHEIPQDLILEGEVTVTADTILTRKLKLPASAAYYLENLLTNSGSFIKMPNIETTLKHNVRVGATALIVGQNSGESRSYMILPTGMYVLNSYPENTSTITGLKLRSNVVLQDDWELLQNLNNSPTFVAQRIFIPAGTKLPGPVDIGAKNSFPRGLSLPGPAQLANTFRIGTLVANTYALPTLTSLAAGSIIKKGSIIASGFKLSGVILSPVKFNASSGMYWLHGETVTTDIYYNYFYGVTPVLTTQDFDRRIQDLEMLVGLLSHK